MFDTFFFSDEAWFHLHYYINLQNYCVWSSKNPHIFQTTSLHSQKNWDLGRHESQMCNGTNVFKKTITVEVYHDVQQFITLLHTDECDAIFQDNAWPSMAKDTVSFLVEFFAEQICKWPPCVCALHLSPLDFFVWTYLKNIVYKNQGWQCQG